MIEHSEFPWGPQFEPGLLTPLGVFGWLVAAALLVLLLVRARAAAARAAGASSATPSTGNTAPSPGPPATRRAPTRTRS